jgi:hypothetical protein
MNTARFRSWFADRIRSAQLLIDNIGEAATSDAEILLCCAISALAAKRWPGKRIDHARFVQFLLDLTPASYAVSSISTPLLGARLRLSGDISGELKLRDAFFPGSDFLILAGKNVDRPEADILSLLPHLDRKLVRAQSYASLIYTGLRSQLVHEYSLSAMLSSFSHSDDVDYPGYSNMTLDDNPHLVADLAQELQATETAIKSWWANPVRQLHFPYVYLRDAITSAAAQAFIAWDSLPQWEVAQPPIWWVDGG